MGDLIGHLAALAHGLLAAFAFALVFHAAGIVLMPRRHDATLGRGETPAMIGAAIYVLVCWFGVLLNVPGKVVAPSFTAAVLVAAALRYRRAVESAHASIRGGAAWLTSFAVFYAIVYVFTLPSVDGEHLPIAWSGNIDLLTYLRYTRHLWELGQSNLVGFGYLNFIYLQTPGLFYLFGWFSMLFGAEPLSAAMPLQFSLMALIGVLSARIAHAVFAIPRLHALSIAAVLVTTPFFRYVSAAYFLSTLMATPVLLYLLFVTVTSAPARWLDLALAVRLAAAYVLLLFIYPFLLFAGVAAQLGAIALLAIVSVAPLRAGAGARAAAAQALRTAATAAAAFAAVTLPLYERLSWSAGMVRGLSQVGVAGWPMNVLSPLAVLGFPRTLDEIDVRNPHVQHWAVAAFAAAAILLIYAFVWKHRRDWSAQARVFVLLCAGGLAAYCAYFMLVGPSYQQWKFATYTMMPFLFAGFAAIVKAVSAPRAVVLGAAAVVVAANLGVHATGDRPLVRPPASLRNFERLNAAPGFREMTLHMGTADVFSTYLALYFVPSKRIHLADSPYDVSHELSYETVSKTRPLFLYGYGCEGAGHGDTEWFEHLGCLLLAPPSPSLDTVYPFNRSFRFVDFDRMTAREPGGRWNTHPELNLTVTADPQRAGVAQDSFLNLFVNPFLDEGAEPITLTFVWGNGKHGEFVLRGQEWISLPVATTDWQGNRVWRTPIAVRFPGGRTILFHELSISHQPRGGVVDTRAHPVSR